MKLNTSQYKLSLYTEDVCEDCQILKEKLKELHIPFENRCITVDREKGKNSPQNVANRWEFIDTATEKGHEVIKHTPVMILEDTSGKKEYYSAGAAFETPSDAITLLHKYCI